GRSHRVAGCRGPLAQAPVVAGDGAACAALQEAGVLGGGSLREALPGEQQDRARDHEGVDPAPHLIPSFVMVRAAVERVLRFRKAGQSGCCTRRCPCCALDLRRSRRCPGPERWISSTVYGPAGVDPTLRSGPRRYGRWASVTRRAWKRSRGAIRI